MKAQIEDGHLVLNFDGDATVKLNLYRMFESFNRDERSAIADALCWNDIMDKAVERLSEGCTAEGSWGGADDEMRLNLLAKMEDQLLSGYKWSWLRELNQASRNIASHEILYWKMYHDEVYGQLFQRWIEQRGIKSNYDDGIESHEAFCKMVEETLKAMRTPKEVVKKVPDEIPY